jgi:hypothetical protein
MDGHRDRTGSRWSPAVSLRTVPLWLSLTVLPLHIAGCASSSESVKAPSDSAVQDTQPRKTQLQKRPEAGKSLQIQSSPDSPRQVQQDKKNVIAEVPPADGEQPRKTKKRTAAEKKPSRKAPSSGESQLPPEPSKPPAIGGSGG